MRAQYFPLLVKGATREREKTGMKLMLEWKWKHRCEVMLFKM